MSAFGDVKAMSLQNSSSLSLVFSELKSPNKVTREKAALELKDLVLLHQRGESSFCVE